MTEWACVNGGIGLTLLEMSPEVAVAFLKVYPLDVIGEQDVLKVAANMGERAAVYTNNRNCKDINSSVL